MSTRREALHDAITEALDGSDGYKAARADRILSDPRVLPLIEEVGSEERERWDAYRAGYDMGRYDEARALPESANVSFQNWRDDYLRERRHLRAPPTEANEPGGGASEGAACVDCGEELGGRHLSGCPLAESVADRLVRPRDTDADSKSVPSAAPQDEPRQQDAEEAWAVIEGWVEEDPAKREQFHPGTIYVHRSVANPRAGWTRAILLAAARAPKEEA